MKQFLSAVLLVFRVFLLLPVSSENITINGTRGAPWFWRCQHTFSEPFHPEQSFIYWQGQNNSNIVVHVYVKGKQEFQHQSQSFRNRTKIFPDQLPSGNFSLVIEPLMLKDDQTSLEVVLSGNKPGKKLCQTTLYVSAPFQKPNIEINQTEMTATCSTKGGYPKPEIKWSSVDGGTGLEPHEVQTTMTSEEDGTYSISSTANITGLQKVTCRVYNPTSNHTTLSETKDMTPETPSSANRHCSAAGLLCVLPLFLLIVCIVVLYLKSQQPTENPSASSAASGDSAERNASDAPPNVSGGNVSGDIVSLTGNQAVFHRSTVKRDGAADSTTDEDTTAADDAEQETKLLSDSKKNADETSTSESDKDK